MTVKFKDLFNISKTYLIFIFISGLKEVMRQYSSFFLCNTLILI